MILIIGGIKGGCGKTTIAFNLVVCQAIKGKKILLVDADEQRSAYDIIEHRYDRQFMEEKILWNSVVMYGEKISKQLDRMKQDYDHIIVDCGGRDTCSQRSAMLSADKFLIPFAPRMLDIWTINQNIKMINDMKQYNKGLRCYAVLNRAESTGGDNEKARQIIQKNSDFILCPGNIVNRKVFNNSLVEGLGVVELSEKDRDKKAVMEIETLSDFIFEVRKNNEPS